MSTRQTPPVTTPKKVDRPLFSTPDQTDEERLNRFQTALSGQLSGGIPSTDILDMLVDRSKTDHPDLSLLLHGPMRGLGNSLDEKKRVFLELVTHARQGKKHLLWERWQREACASDPGLGALSPLAVNIAFPAVISSDKEFPFLTYIGLISHPEDAERIARLHIRKQPNFTPIFFQSLIATTNNEHWKNQRAHLAPVFLPKASLAKIFPTSVDRAKACATRLGGLARDSGKYGVQMHEFFLHEAQAQLQLALFGMDEAFMESTNKNIRDVFAGTQSDPNYGKDMCLNMLRKVGENDAFASAVDDEVLSGRKPVFGPLSKSVADAGTELNMNIFDQFGNMMLILFAGHDTTAHTMTWFAYEMAKHPEHQRRIQAEVDELFDLLANEGREMEYEDCVRLPFMTRCVMETLRLWTAVPNGTFRELQFDEQVRGPGGGMVTLPKGSYVQITNWTRHRNTDLWGNDAHIFNPDREFRENEIWGGHGATETVNYAGSNPASKRFSPFTFTPRDCLGKNFAQMEMRTILSNVFRNYTVELSEPYKNNDQSVTPVENVQGTMGPRDLTPEGMAESARRFGNGQAPQQAMYLHVIPRRTPPARL